MSTTHSHGSSCQTVTDLHTHVVFLNLEPKVRTDTTINLSISLASALRNWTGSGRTW